MDLFASVLHKSPHFGTSGHCTGWAIHRSKGNYNYVCPSSVCVSGSNFTSAHVCVTIDDNLNLE